jgi:hypothetical protein
MILEYFSRKKHVLLILFLLPAKNVRNGSNIVHTLVVHIFFYLCIYIQGIPLIFKEVIILGRRVLLMSSPVGTVTRTS